MHFLSYWHTYACHWGQQPSKNTSAPLGLSYRQQQGSLHNSCYWNSHKETFILAVSQTFATLFTVIFWIINRDQITSKVSAENKSKGLSEALVLISSASNSLPTSKFPITSSSPRAERESKLIHRSSVQVSFYYMEASENLPQVFLIKKRI